MIDPSGPLARAIDSGTVGELLPSSSAAGPDLERAAARYGRGLTVMVVGRGGVGRDTMARALRERLAVAAIGPGDEPEASADADLWIHLLAGMPRRTDRKLLAELPAERTIVVLGKADTHGHPDDAAVVAADAAAVLGRPVVSVSQLLACATITDDELAYLRTLVAADVVMPSMAGQFLAGLEPGSAERLMRMGLLRRVDAFGIDTAMELIRSGHRAADDADALSAALRALSGIDALRPAIAERVGPVRYWRGVELRARLELAAAAGRDRDVLEGLLGVG